MRRTIVLGFTMQAYYAASRSPVGIGLRGQCSQGGSTPVSETAGAPGDRIRALTICGGGNAGHALAVAISQHATAHIDWLVSSAEKADLLRRGVSRGGLRSTGVFTAEAHRLRTISSDPAEVIPNADIVLLAVPA